MSMISIIVRGFQTRRRIACLAIAVVAAIPSAGARAEYPNRPVTIVSCFPAGGGTDIAMRLINTELGEALGKPVIVENRGGAGGSLGATFVARAPADG